MSSAGLTAMRSELKRIQASVFERAQQAKIPLTIIVMPGKDHVPDADLALPLPRALWRTQRAVCIVYDPEVGQPEDATIGRLVDGGTP